MEKMSTLIKVAEDNGKKIRLYPIYYAGQEFGYQYITMNERIGKLFPPRVLLGSGKLKDAKFVEIDLTKDDSTGLLNDPDVYYKLYWVSLLSICYKHSNAGHLLFQITPPDLIYNNPNDPNDPRNGNPAAVWEYKKIIGLFDGTKFWESSQLRSEPTTGNRYTQVVITGTVGILKDEHKEKWSETTKFIPISVSTAFDTNNPSNWWFRPWWI